MTALRTGPAAGASGARIRPLVIASLVFALAACGGPSPAPVRTIAFVGDSITQGIVGNRQRDPLGGYPSRLQRRLGGDVRVLNLGVGGASAGLWLQDPQTSEGARTLALFGSIMPDAPAIPDAPAARTVVGAVLHASRPDLVVLLLGINDLGERRDRGPAVVDEVVARIDRVYREASANAGTVLVATLLPNHRDPDDLREQINARLRAAYPDHLPLGERFAAAQWTTLLADEIHPSPEGYEVIAEILAKELVARGLVLPPAAS